MKSPRARKFVWLLLAGILSFVAGCKNNPPSPARVKTEPTVTINRQTWTVELALTGQQQYQGLSGRTYLADDRGMLFVFPSPGRPHFYMKNTRIPLSIAFIRADGIITNISKMTPLDETPRHFPTETIIYALEMNQGWFERNGIRAGHLVELPDSVKAKTP